MTDEDATKYTKLFVGGIPYHTEDETMKEYFLQFDDIVEAVIIRERNSQRSKGYGFVSYFSYDTSRIKLNRKNYLVLTRWPVIYALRNFSPGSSILKLIQKSDSYNSVESGDIKTHGHGLSHDSGHAEAIQRPIVSQKSASWPGIQDHFKLCC